MFSDFEVEPGRSFGEWLHAELADACHFEREGFMPERVRRVASHLQADRPAEERYLVEVPWLQAFTAFTAPGRYVYFSRRMLERCPDDETTAFVIAHEIAHHDLGHLEMFQGRFAQRLARVGAGALVVLFFRHLQRRLYSPEREVAADLRALELCVQAGYQGSKCLRIFDIMEEWALDWGDLGMVYGPDVESDEELDPEADLLTRTRIWIYQRERGYLPIRDRAALLRKHLATVSPTPIA